MRVFLFVFRYLRHIRSASDEEKGGGFESKLACMRALLDAVNGLFYLPDQVWQTLITCKRKWWWPDRHHGYTTECQGQLGLNDWTTDRHCFSVASARSRCSLCVCQRMALAGMNGACLLQQCWFLPLTVTFFDRIWYTAMTIQVCFRKWGEK